MTRTGSATGLTAAKLVPDQLMDLWRAVESGDLDEDEFVRTEQQLVGEYRSIWTEALALDGDRDLVHSLVAELAEYVQCDDLDEVRRRCEAAQAGVEREWRDRVDPRDPGSIQEYYDRNRIHLYELLWWHTLAEDASPLAYVTALHFARQRGLKAYLDFGAGVGSGGILFARHGLRVALADISTTMLDFCEWRFGYRRSLPVQIIDLKFTELPRQAFDLVTAMDVFEHLVDPLTTMERVWESLKPGGYLVGRFNDAREDDHRGTGESLEHVAKDFRPLFERMKSLGFQEVWQDAWLWGHQVFQKR